MRRENGSLRVKRPATPTPVGIWLDDPNEALPEDRNDPRIWDQDQDGNPGFTVHIELKGEAGDAQAGGEIYLVRREIFAYDLTVGDDGTLTGTITDTSEQLVVGASNPVFEA